jgi:hypothetical protein
MSSKKTPPTQEELIARFEKAQKAYEKADDELRQHFNRLVTPKIKEAKTLEDLRLVKESLRVMPESVGKVLLFRAIILTEDAIKGERCTKCLLETAKCRC